MLAPVAPPPPDYLTLYAREEWDRILGELYRLKLLTVFDTHPFEAYCESYSKFRTANEALQVAAAADPIHKGLLVQGSLKNLVANPLIAVARHAARDMVKYASEFGFTPAARSRIISSEATRAAGKFEGLLRGQTRP
jgi:P27 family predicted phage terminase small subunit